MRSGIPTILIVLLVISGFGFLIYTNSQPATPLRVVIPTQQPATEVADAYDIFRPGFGSNSTPLPTIAIPDIPFVAPTLIPANQTPTLVEASSLLNQDLYTLEPEIVGASPTPPPTLPPVATEEGIEEVAVAAKPTIPWQPQTLDVPQSRDPLGRDHYWFNRPVDPNGQNFGIFNYPYGADGSDAFNNPSRIHHGIDMPNEVGAPIRAAESGIVLFASTPDNQFFQGSPSYGNVVFIEHDFGWNDQPIYTLYAHLQSAVVQTGQRVEAGDVIGINGNSGNSTGAHVHFEVRTGGDRYGDTLNPVLWLAPYVGHGTIAGRLVDENGDYVQDYDITLREWSTQYIVTSTTTYIFDNTVDDVNPDPNWQENFVFADIPAGSYSVIANYNGRRLTQRVQVFEGMTTFVELEPLELETAQPVPTEQDES